MIALPKAQRVRMIGKGLIGKGQTPFFPILNYLMRVSQNS